MSVTLVPTGREVTTITASPHEACDPDGGIWYVKNDDSEQAQQLRFLAELGLPIPEVMSIGDGKIASRHAGVSLDQVIKAGDRPGAEAIVSQAGALLSRVHTALGPLDNLPSEEMWAPPNPVTTAQPAVNFAYRFIDARSSATNAMASGDLPEAASAVRGRLRYLVSIMQETGMPDGLLAETEMSYGDYKPENILSNSDGKLYLIDPLLHKGNRIADLAKFCSRYALEPNAPNLETSEPFLAGYQAQHEGHRFDEEEFVWLSALDTANILSSYLGRLAKGDKRFRIVSQLAHNPSYSARVCGLVDGAMSALENAHGQ